MRTARIVSHLPASFLETFTDDLVELEFGPLPEATRAGAREWVAARIGGAGEVTRLGLAVAGKLLAVSVRVRTGSAYADLSRARRLQVAAGLAAARGFPAAEYVKAVRSLAVSFVYETR